MKNLQRHLQIVADARRRELIPYVFHHTSGVVQQGPFVGMVIHPNSMWGDGDVVGKILGVYENELHNFVEQAISSNPDCIINIGAAEGYYSVGFATRLPNVPVLAVDIDPRSAAIVIKNSNTNQVNNVQAITAEVDAAWLEKQCATSQKPLLVVDCEGAESVLLDPVTVPSLKNASILVESHDCVIAGLTEQLINRFNHSHTIQSIDQQHKDPYQFAFLKELSDCDKWALVHEGRPSTMTWLYMVPRT
jgi:hypothetical protein